MWGMVSRSFQELEGEEMNKKQLEMLTIALYMLEQHRINFIEQTADIFIKEMYINEVVIVEELRKRFEDEFIKANN